MDCCAVSKQLALGETACPSCATVGRVVGDETIEAILNPTQAHALLAVGRWFCGTPSCEVVYYGDDGRTLTKREIPFRVGLKEREDPIPLCYCFGFSEADVRREIVETGRCTIPARITAEVRAGRCSCEITNPSGTCCLGEVNRAVKREHEGRASGSAGRSAVALTLTSASAERYGPSTAARSRARATSPAPSPRRTDRRRAALRAGARPCRARAAAMPPAGQ